MQDWRFCRVLCIAALLFSAGAHASLIPIDLNDFYADPTVTVAADGSSAYFEEDSGLAEVLLSNDPGLGDPNVIVPGSGVYLVFEYDFAEALGENDEFGAFLIDAATGLSVGAGYEFFVQASGSGTGDIDISALVGYTLGLHFQLAKLSGDIGSLSTATVSNVRLEIQTASAPATLVLLAAGLIGLIQIKRSSRPCPTDFCRAILRWRGVAGRRLMRGSMGCGG